MKTSVHLFFICLLLISCQNQEPIIQEINTQTEEEINTRKRFTDYIKLINQDDWADHIAPYLSDLSFIERFKDFRTAFTNYNATIKHMTVEGNHATAWLIVKAKHVGVYNGPFAGKESLEIDPTNKDLEWEEVWHFDLDGEKFGSVWDFMSQDIIIMQQLGLTIIPKQ